MTAVNGQDNRYDHSQCTYWADERYHTLTGYYVPWMDDAKNWNDQAKTYGWTVSDKPTVPSIICLEPGVQGADTQYGHVGVVEKIVDDLHISASNLNWGETPTQKSQVQNVTFSTGTGVSFINTGQNTTSITETVSLDDFFYQVIGQLGSDHTDSLRIFMCAWALQESGSNLKNGSSAQFNPLNTTQVMNKGETNFNIIGVKNYPDFDTGVAAIVKTLQNGNYSTLLHAIATNDDGNLGISVPSNGMAENVAKDLATWVTGKKSITKPIENYCESILANSGVTGAYIRDYSTANSMLKPATSEQILAMRNIIIGRINKQNQSSNPMDTINNFLSSIGGNIKSITDFLSNPTRLVKIVLGTILLIVGLILMIMSFTNSPTGKTIAKTAATLAA